MNTKNQKMIINTNGTNRFIFLKYQLVPIHGYMTRLLMASPRLCKTSLYAAAVRA